MFECVPKQYMHYVKVFGIKVYSIIFKFFIDSQTTIRISSITVIHTHANSFANIIYVRIYLLA